MKLFLILGVLLCFVTLFSCDGEEESRGDGTGIGSPPSNVTASYDQESHSILISWRAPATRVGKGSYLVYQSFNSPVTSSDKKHTINSDVNEFHLTLDEHYYSKTVYFAVSFDFNASEASELSEEVSIKAAPNPNGPDLTSLRQLDNGIALEWAEQANVVKYHIYSSVDENLNVNATWQTSVNGDTTGDIVGSLIDGVEYYFAVTAERDGKESKPGSPSRRITYWPDSAGIPPAPENLVISHSGCALITLSWTQVGNASYRVYINGRLEGVVNKGVRATTIIGSEFDITLPGTYIFEISALVNNNEGPKSLPVSCVKY